MKTFYQCEVCAHFSANKKVIEKCEKKKVKSRSLKISKGFVSARYILIVLQ